MEIEVAIPSPLPQTFTYYHPEPLVPGVRVRVPFHTQGKVMGVVLGAVADRSKEERGFSLKSVADIIDQEPVYSKILLDLARWMSQYYMYPLGEVLRTMLPASKQKKHKVTWELTGGPASDDACEQSVEDLAPARFFSRKKTISDVTLRAKLREREVVGPAQVKLLAQWQKRGWIAVAHDRDFKARTSDDLLKIKSEGRIAQELFRQLNVRQRHAVDVVISEGLANDKRVPFLLFGVTGSGKTEVFLNIIRSVLEDESAPGQALVLVPEISLTPQMTHIFSTRFPGMVAVVHSAMEDDERWRELDRVRRGEAKVLIGPRSAVFGPFLCLKLVIVDEEHDSSYKQGSGLLYHARDVAIVRAKLEGATVVLGSATPSMESWHNAHSGKYRILELPERASSRPLPTVETVLAKPSFKAVSLVGSDGEGDSPFSDEVIKALQDNLVAGHQSIVLVNRRGYAYYLLNLSENKAATCPQCSINLSVHARRMILRCHYCDYQTTTKKIIDASPEGTWAVVGYGSQKAEEALAKILPTARIARLDSDKVADPRALPDILAKFRRGDLDLLVGTQILAKGHDFPNVTLIAILEVDQLLGLPDFRGGERTFQLLVQAAGRAGRGEHAGRVIVQSMRIGHPVVKQALAQDFRAFAETEMQYREVMGYPPYGRMVLFEFNSEDAHKLDQWCRDIEDKIEQLLMKQPELAKHIKILGPSPAPIEIIRGRVRRTLIVMSTVGQMCRKMTAWLAEVAAKPPGDIRVKIDVDPQATL